jgi:putative phage-type endonuclease
MNTYLNELEELEDVSNEIVFEYDDFFNEETSLELVETVLYLIDDYIQNNPTAITEEDFYDILLEEVREICYIQFEEFIVCETTEEDFDELLESALNLFCIMNNLERSVRVETEIETDTYDDEKRDMITNKILYLKSLPQPNQRTPEWYNFRHNLITASNAYKAYGSQSAQNQLIYEKCLPLKTSIEEQPTMVNINSPFHWGQKYEPLSVQLYEAKYNTRIDDFGCIQHDTYNFIGASPDGINVKIDSNLYGRMLEIKNVVSRDITGNPKKEYWIQMQLQMEVCDLDECDFLETKFVEYNNYTEFKNDTTEKTKGSIIYFNTKESKPFYLYKPLEIVEEDEIIKWEEDMINKYQSTDYGMMWIKHIYWKLDIFSCVLVLRNSQWFNENISSLQTIWQTILYERENGYQHRAPTKRIIKPKEDQVSKGCLIDAHKLLAFTC